MIDAPGVSRRHARITLGPASMLLTDLGSKNGTFLNDTAIVGPTPIADGDRVRFGTVGFVVRAAGIETLTRQ